MLPHRGIFATQQWTEQSLQDNLPKPSREVQMHARWSRDLADYKDKLWFKKDGPEVHSKQKTPCRDYSCPASTMAAVLLESLGPKFTLFSGSNDKQPQQHYEVQHQGKNHHNSSSRDVAWQLCNLSYRNWGKTAICSGLCPISHL